MPTVRVRNADPHDTLDRMARLVMASYDLPIVVTCGASIAARAVEKNNVAIAYAMMMWLRVHTRFVAAPLNIQLLKSPAEMLTQVDRDAIVGGDCVSVAMLAAALGMSVSVRARFIAEGYEPAEPAALTHVYAQLHTEAGWLTLDTQRPIDSPPVTPVLRVLTTIP